MYSGSKLWKTKVQAWKRSKPNSELHSNKTDQNSSLTQKRLEANRTDLRIENNGTIPGSGNRQMVDCERRFRLSSLYVDGVLVHVVRGQTPSERNEGYTVSTGVTGAGRQYSADGGRSAGERIETERGVAGAGSRSGVTVFML